MEFFEIIDSSEIKGPAIFGIFLLYEFSSKSLH
jgi:hypothetical protein